MSLIKRVRKASHSAYYEVVDVLSRYGLDLKNEPEVYDVKGNAVVVGHPSQCNVEGCEAKPRYVVHVWLEPTLCAKLYLCRYHLREAIDLAYKGMEVGYQEV